ncbi:MAG: AEC family transporter, partial [Cyanobacteriota bacterium]
MTAILSAILPVLTIVLIGFWAGKSFALDRVSLSRITLYIFTPALVAESLYRSPITLENAKGLFLAFSLTYALMGAIAWGLSGLLRFP